MLALAENEVERAGGVGVTEVADRVGREKSQVSRSLKVLAEYGFIERDEETLGYRLSWRFFALAGRVADARLLTAAPHFLRALVSELGERAHLSVLEGRHVLTVMSESPDHAVQTAGWIGRTVPVHCTSAGRALLLDHGRDDLENLLGGIDLRHGRRTAPGDLEALYKRIVADRARGYALVKEEFEEGLVAVAAPVRDFSGRIVAALNVSAPKFRFGRRLNAGGASVRAAGEGLSALLGWESARGVPVPTPSMRSSRAGGGRT